MMKRHNLTLVVSQLVFKTFTAGHGHLSVLHNGLWGAYGDIKMTTDIVVITLNKQGVLSVLLSINFVYQSSKCLKPYRFHFKPKV